MPYIEQRLRTALDQKIDGLVIEIKSLNKGEHVSAHAGVLNYVVTRMILGLMDEVKYWKIALYCGVLSNIASEFYRKLAVPYEDKKIAENGDVYPPA
jgi:hypothetical protein